jgi:hypothetical protein
MPDDPYDLPNASALTAIGGRPAGGGQALGVSTAALADHVCDSWHRRQIRLFPETADPSSCGYGGMRFAANPRLCVGVAIAAILCCAAPAAADTASFQGNVFRYRAEPPPGPYFFTVELHLVPDFESPTHLEPLVQAPVTTGPGCTAESMRFDQASMLSTRVRCPLSAPPSAMNYRLSLGHTHDRVGGAVLRGVVFAGRGNDEVNGGDRAYGGPGNDLLDGRRVYGGPGADRLTPVCCEGGRAFVMRGGPGNDEIFGAGRAYGGPGADSIEDTSTSADMFVGGPGRDTIEMFRDGESDIVRVRGGGADRVVCDDGVDRSDVVLVGRADRVDRRCQTGQVMLTGRPRQLWP